MREVPLGQRKKPLPIYVLERVHELITDFGRPERKAVREACQQFISQLGGGKPFSRVRTTYREKFKPLIGVRSLREFRIQRAAQETRESEQWELAKLQQHLADLEGRAPAVFGTDDLSEESLERFISEQGSEEFRELKDILHRADGEVPKAFRKKYGHLPDDQEISQLLDAVKTAEDRADLAHQLRAFRDKVANFEQQKISGYL